MDDYSGKRWVVSLAIFICLILPLIPLAVMCSAADKLSKAKWAKKWVEWADRKSNKIAGVMGV